MADGGLKLELEKTLGERLQAAADAVGRPVDELAAALISDGLDDDWAEAYARHEDHQRTGESLDAEVEMTAFRDAVRARFRTKAG